MTRVAPGAAPAGLHGFTVALSTFVGRSGEVAKVGSLLAEHRLVTVTGPGGVGKTRLAGEVARRMAGQFADGVCLVELAGVSEPALVGAAVAVALGAYQAPGQSISDALAALLAEQQLLLALDNCEHVLAAVAELCGSLLPVADDVRILATSREPIGLTGEARYRLAPLSLPAGPVDIRDSEAVMLFADRARLVDPQFTLTDESGPQVAQLVRRLDGMPLAIELAAARVEALGVAGLADRLDDRFRLLVSGDRLAARRQRSLAATVEWSYELLAEQEREAFRRLAVFPGPFTLAAAEAVAGAHVGPAVLHLVDCSLLVQPRAGPDGRDRYTMLETVRAYAAERLAEAGEGAEAAAGLAGFALRVAEDAATGLEASAGELAAAQWLDAEDATVHLALAWALRHDPATAVRLAVALARWWLLRSRRDLGYQMLAAAAEQAADDGQRWAAAQVWLGVLAVDHDVGLRHFTEARDALAENGPSRLLVRALNGRASVRVNLGPRSEAVTEARRALALARELGYPAGEALALRTLQTAAHYSGDLRGSLAWAREAERIDAAAIPGSVVRDRNILLTVALMDSGEYAEAQRCCTETLALARQAGDGRHQAECLQIMADLDLLAGRFAGTREHLREAIEIVSRVGDLYSLMNCLETCGHLCAQTNRGADALTVWAALAALIHSSGIADIEPEADRRGKAMRDARQALGVAQATAAENRGAAMGSSAAAEYVALLVAAGSEQRAAAALELPRLSAREQELVKLVAQGRTNGQIAGQLFISVRTVSSHLDRIRDKTGCRRRADLTRLALQSGLV